MPTNHVESIARACRLLRELADMGGGTMADLSQALELPTSTVDRLLKTLTAEGMVERFGERFGLGCGLARLWAAYRLELMESIQEANRKLHETQIPGEIAALPGSSPEEWQ